MTKCALVTGYSGQDGTFLTRLLLDKGYKVVGLVRRVSTEPPYRVRGKFDFTKELDDGQLILEVGDLLSPKSLNTIIAKHMPHEIYNLGAQSDVGISFKEPESTMQIDFMGMVNLITALENHGIDWKLYQASTSEMFGDKPNKTILNLKTPFTPNSPYAIAKTAAHHYMQMKRKEGRFCANGILFNHESEIRGGNFVTQKIAKGVVAWQNDRKVLELGNLDSVRDWGYAGDFVKAMHLIMQQEQPDDYIVATGQSHTVRDFVEAAFKAIGQEIMWVGGGIYEVGLVNGFEAVKVNFDYYRPVDVTYLHGDATKINKLGWRSTVTFQELVKLMVEAQL
jgi:GDPmannose 4,6-dehydratase